MSKPLSDLYHLAMAGWYTFQLALDNKAVQNTYGYCMHLERVSFVDRRFRRWLDRNLEIVQAMMRPVTFIDREPDVDGLATLPEGTLGREYYKVALQYRTGELDYLRPLRLKTLPHEVRGLDPTVPGTADAAEAVRSETGYPWLVARRNIYMTTSHDLAHLVAGCDVSLEGEALVAMYQFHHLRVPQNFMNMWAARLKLSITGNFEKIRRIRNAWTWVEASTNPVKVDWDSLWTLPLGEARRRIGLPGEGLQLAPVPGADPDRLPA